MIDQEIADALVEAGILRPAGKRTYYLYGPGLSLGPECRAGEALRDWRTAGACLERMKYEVFTGEHPELDANGSLPRAICQVYVESLK